MGARTDEIPWLDEVSGPLVLVTASSEMQGDDGLIRTAIEALGGTDLAVVISTAAHDPGRFDAPGNVRVQRWLQHLPIMQRAAAVVCHGGMGITQKALAAGVPVCVVPFGRDQFEVAKLVGGSGCGTVVMPDQLDPAQPRVGGARSHEHARGCRTRRRGVPPGGWSGGLRGRRREPRRCQPRDLSGRSPC